MSDCVKMCFYCSVEELVVILFFLLLFFFKKILREDCNGLDLKSKIHPQSQSLVNTFLKTSPLDFIF